MNNFNKVGNLQQRDLELQKKLAEINNIAVKMLMTKKPPLPVVPLSKDKNPSIQKKHTKSHFRFEYARSRFSC